MKDFEFSDGKSIPNFRGWNDYATRRAIVMIIDPDSAREILRHQNTKNRPCSPVNIVKYARDMTAGNWKVNGEAIVFAWNGRLMDGQNRLHACVKTGIPLVTFVVFGVDPDAFDTINQGKKRGVGEALGIAGERNGKNLAASIALLNTYETSTSLSGFVSVKPLTVGESDEVLRRHPGLRESVSYICSRNKTLWFLMPRVGSVCHYLFTQIAPFEADLFFDDLASGVGLDYGDPVLYLRNRLMREKDAKAKLPMADIMALTIKAWNIRRSGRKVLNKQLNWKSGGLKPEPFPKPI